MAVYYMVVECDPIGTLTEKKVLQALKKAPTRRFFNTEKEAAAFFNFYVKNNKHKNKPTQQVLVVKMERETPGWFTTIEEESKQTHHEVPFTIPEESVSEETKKILEMEYTAETDSYSSVHALSSAALWSSTTTSPVSSYSGNKEFTFPDSYQKLPLLRQFVYESNDEIKKKLEEKLVAILKPEELHSLFLQLRNDAIKEIEGDDKFKKLEEAKKTLVDAFLAKKEEAESKWKIAGWITLGTSYLIKGIINLANYFTGADKKTFKEKEYTKEQYTLYKEGKGKFEKSFSFLPPWKKAKISSKHEVSKEIKDLHSTVKITGTGYKHDRFSLYASYGQQVKKIENEKEQFVNLHNDLIQKIKTECLEMKTNLDNDEYSFESDVQSLKEINSELIKSTLLTETMTFALCKSSLENIKEKLTDMLRTISSTIDKVSRENEKELKNHLNQRLSSFKKHIKDIDKVTLQFQQCRDKDENLIWNTNELIKKSKKASEKLVTAADYKPKMR